MNYSLFEKLCKDKGTTPTALSKKLGLSKGNTSNWKNGGNPSVDILCKLADELNCTTDELLGRESSSTPKKCNAYSQNISMGNISNGTVSNNAGDNIIVNNSATLPTIHFKDSEYAEVYAEIIDQLESLDTSSRFNTLYKIKRLLEDNCTEKKNSK